MSDGSHDDGPARSDFIRDIVRGDLESGRTKAVVTRFPPEPNGFLHIGHAKSICLNFGVALDFDGRCNLRFDDTNPEKEDQIFIDSIQKDVAWLGFEWGDEAKFASDYFETLYGYALALIEKGLAYVDDQSAEEMRTNRGTLKEPGKDSPWRNRSVQENLDLFKAMRAGEFEAGSRALRAKIDMASGNINLRDPVIYRIRYAHHPRTGDTWCIYPSYDFAHGQSDAIEGVTHSICTLEFEDHRPLYDWLIENLPVPATPRQYEFARLNLSHTLMSKRRLLQLVDEGHVDGWNDPRMPTLAGLRRRGIPPEAIRDFAGRIGVAKADSLVELAMLDACVREFLNKHAIRRMAVMKPVKLLLTNYPDDQIEHFDAINNPEDEGAGTRKLPFSKELWIERDDFMEDPPKKFFRLAPGREVRLRYAYLVTCTGVVKDEAGEITEIHATYDPETRGGDAPDGRRVKATMHWLSADQAKGAEVRLINPLFSVAEPGREHDAMEDLNPDSFEIVHGVKIEQALLEAEPENAVQFERLGYFTRDGDNADGIPRFNRTVGLRDTWAKVKARS